LVSPLKAYTLYVVLLRSGALCIYGLDLAVVQECSIVDLLQSFRLFFYSCLDGLDANVLVYNNFGTVSKNILMVLMPMYCLAVVLSPVSWRSWCIFLCTVSKNILMGLTPKYWCTVVLSPVSWRSWYIFLGAVSKKNLDGLDAYVLVYSGIISNVFGGLGTSWKSLERFNSMLVMIGQVR